MKKIQNLMLVNLQPTLSIKSKTNQNFPKYEITNVKSYYDNNGTISSVSRIAGSDISSPNNQDAYAQFGNYYYVPKFDSTFTDPTLCRVNYLISFDSNKTNKIIKWQLKYGDGTYSEGIGPENLLLINNNLSSSDTTIKAKLNLNGNFQKISTVGTLLIDNEYINYTQMGINLTTPTWSSINSYGYGILLNDISSTDTTIKVSNLEKSFTGVSGLSATNVFTKLGHDLTNGTVITLSSLSGGSNLSTSSTFYYVINSDIAKGTFQLSTSASGSVQTLGSDVASVTINVSNYSKFASSGSILIDDEVISYTTASSDPDSTNKPAIATGNFSTASGTLLKDLPASKSDIITGGTEANDFFEINSTDNFPESGTILVDNEQINYNKKTNYGKISSIAVLADGVLTIKVENHNLVSGSLIKINGCNPNKYNGWYYVNQKISNDIFNVINSEAITDELIIVTNAILTPTLYELTRGVNGTTATSHATNAIVKNINVTNVVESTGNFKIGSLIKDASNTVIPTDTYISNIQNNIYSEGLISYNGTSVTGYGTNFTSNMINKIITYPDGTEAKIVTQPSATSLTTNTTSTKSSIFYVNSAQSLPIGTYYKCIYYTSAPHNIEIGDYVTVSNMNDTDYSFSGTVVDAGQPTAIGILTTVVGTSGTPTTTVAKNSSYTLTAAAGTFRTKEIVDGILVTGTAVFAISNYNSDTSVTAICLQSGNLASNKKFELTYNVPSNTFDIAAATASGTIYTIYTTGDHDLKSNDYITISDARIPAYNGTFKVTVTNTTTFTITGLTSSPDSMNPLDKNAIGSNGTIVKNANVMFALLKSTDPGATSDGKGTSGSLSQVNVYKKYKIVNGLNITLNQPVKSNSSNLTFYTPGPTLTTLNCTRGTQSTTATNHYKDTSVGQLAVYNNVPYVAIQSHSATTTTPNNSKYWLKIDDQKLIITFSNLTRGAFVTTAASHKINSLIKGVIKTSHYYQYDGGENQNGFMHVVLTGTDNHNRNFVYNTIVYPKTDTETNWTTNTQLTS
jgi:hypothetical protein